MRRQDTLVGRHFVGVRDGSCHGIADCGNENLGILPVRSSSAFSASLTATCHDVSIDNRRIRVPAVNLTGTCIALGLATAELRATGAPTPAVPRSLRREKCGMRPAETLGGTR